MDHRRNRFKAAVAKGERQIGLWCTLSSAYAAEVVAGAAFDWLLFDTEHSPSDLETVLSLLQAVSAYPVSALVRPASNDPVLIKRYLDIGAQTLLIPYVQNAEQAKAAVAATRYPPEGIRGVSALTRASGFGRVPGYSANAASEICLLVQVETEEALAQIETIAAVDGVDGIFVGPGDLAASMGHLGQPAHPAVQRAVEAAIERIVSAGKPAGLLTASSDIAKRCLEIGAIFVAVGVDVGLLARSSDALALQFADQTR